MKISVVYITNGLKPNVLNKCIQSANFANEIIVVGTVNSISANVKKIEAVEFSKLGMISKMRNIGATAATGDLIINADDDIFFPPAFKTKLLRFVKSNPTIESFNTKVIGVNGSRCWDRSVHDKNGNSYMIQYDETHPELYYSGAFIVRKKEFAHKYKWNNNLKYYEKEDVEYSNRIKQKGYSINIDTKNYVIHLDPNYISYINHNGKLVCDKLTNTTMCNQVQEKQLREIKTLLSFNGLL
jgi:choline kinase